MESSDNTLDTEQLLAFIARLRTFGNAQAYKDLVNTAQANFTLMTTDTWRQLLSRIDYGIRLGSPGHDFGHARRDLLGAFAVAIDDTLKQYLPAEITAGIIAGFAHDYSTAFDSRYRDNDTIAGHAEKGAFRIYLLFSGVLEENLLLLVCYAIAAHTHYLEAKVCADGSVREPWYYELLQDGGQEYGWAVFACRFADRLDCNGSTILLRHLIANSDASENGGQDLSGSTYYDLNQEAIEIMVLPHVVTMEKSKGKKSPSALQHISNFAKSNFGNSKYSEKDHLFPVMSALMEYKVAQTTYLCTPYEPKVTDLNRFSLGLADPIEELKELLYRISRAPRFEEAWKVLEKALSKLSENDLAIWAHLVEYLAYSYDLWLEYLRATIVHSQSEYVTPIIPLLDGLIEEIS